MKTIADQIFVSLGLPLDTKETNIVLTNNVITIETISEYLQRVDLNSRYLGLRVIINSPSGNYNISNFISGITRGTITQEEYWFQKNTSNEGFIRYVYVAPEDIPTKLSDLEDDSEFISGTQVPNYETDPIFVAWLLTNPLASFLTDETDPIFTAWLLTNPLINFVTTDDNRLSNSRTPTTHANEYHADTFLTAETLPFIPQDHVGLYDPIGSAGEAISTHEQTYNHSDFVTAEEDPIFQQWLESDPLGNFVTELEAEQFNVNAEESATKAQQWAESEYQVEEEKYSSKYWAEKSKQEVDKMVELTDNFIAFAITF